MDQQLNCTNDRVVVGRAQMLKLVTPGCLAIITIQNLQTTNGLGVCHLKQNNFYESYQENFRVTTGFV